jgi:hypothetical protein
VNQTNSFFNPDAQAALVRVVRAMLDGSLPFIEGADLILALQDQAGCIPSSDPDFRVFSVIQSETDHLPRQDQRGLWSQTALAGIDAELQRSEVWARTIGTDACRNLSLRFG